MSKTAKRWAKRVAIGAGGYAVGAVLWRYVIHDRLPFGDNANPPKKIHDWWYPEKTFGRIGIALLWPVDLVETAINIIAPPK